MSTIFSLGKHLQVDEPEILTQATGYFLFSFSEVRSRREFEIPVHLAERRALSACLPLSEP